MNLILGFYAGCAAAVLVAAPCTRGEPVPVSEQFATSKEPIVDAAGFQENVRRPGLKSVTVSFYSHGNPTAEEQLMLELVNRARLNPTAEAARFGIDLNEGITEDPISPAPKQPISFNADLIQSARGHSTWMLDNDTFAHVETNGSDPGSRMAAAGYMFSGGYGYGENIAWRGTTGTVQVGPTVAQEHQDLFVDEGISDRGHRRNLLTGSFREIGIGVESGVFALNGTGYHSVMVTQDFAISGANPGPFLVGVAYKDANKDGAYSVGEGLAGITVSPAGATFAAVSSTSGGYSIPITGLSGTLEVTFSGGALTRPVTKSVALTGQNVKLDFEFNADTVPALGFVGSSFKFASPSHFQGDLQGPVNARVSIQSSTDLSNWSEISQVTLTATGARFTDSSAGAGRRYYRVVKQ
jgi:hypothetical protein